MVLKRASALLLCSVLAFTAAAADDPGKVRIDVPALNATVTSSRVLTRGTVVSTSTDISVLVNDVPAQIDLQHKGTKDDPFRWVALLEGEPGRLKLKARLVDQKGRETAASSRHIDFVPLPEFVAIRPVSASGVAPFSIEFTITTALTRAVQKVEIDYDGDGNFDSVTDAVPEHVGFRYETPGIRVASMRVTDDSGVVFTDAAPVTVHSFATMHKILMARWNGFVGDLARGDAANALILVTADAKPRYRKAFTLIQPTLPQFAAGLRTLEPIWITGSTAHYLLTRVESGRLRGYHVYFSRDESGLWKIAQF